jgi:hypothetical protein
MQNAAQLAFANQTEAKKRRNKKKGRIAAPQEKIRY